MRSAGTPSPNPVPPRGARASGVIPSHLQRGEGRAALAAKGEGALGLSPAPSLGFASAFPLPLKGARRFQRVQNSSKHFVEVCHHVGVCETQHSVAAGFQIGRAKGVVDFPPTMRVSVQLDYKPFGPCGKIRDVWGEHDPSLKFYAKTVRAKAIPEPPLGFGQVGPQIFGAISRFDVPLQESPYPRPLPLKGERVRAARHAPSSFESVRTVNA